MRKISIALILCIHIGAQGQSFREIFTEANLLTEDGLYGLAIPFWEALLEENPDNANVNYKLGRCYLGLGIDRDQALPYLIKASEDIRKNYDPFSAGFEGAPFETYFYLGKAQHIAGTLNEAEANYQRFMNESAQKHILRPEAEKGLEMCQVARELMAAPVDVKITNIGTPINSAYAEYSPIVAFDENALYYTSRRLRTDGSNEGEIEAQTGLYYEDMYVSFKNLQGGWMNPELLNINIPNAHSSVVSMSHDGQRLYTYKSYRSDGNIFESVFEMGTGWSDPTLLGSDINTKYNEYFAAISADGQILYFVSDRPGGLGGKDIWYCKKLPTGDWGKAINMGAPVNTPFDEDAPYIHPNGKTMYFSSNGHRSMGGYDIFSTQKVGENWSMPINLGYPINTTDDDHSYITTPSGNRAYYSSKGSGTIGSTDIYVIEYPEEEKTPKIDMSGFAVLKGWVLTCQGSLPSSFKIYVQNTATKTTTGEATPVARNGSFVFIIPSGETYQIDYTLGDDTLITEQITIAAGEQYKELKREIILSPDRNGSMEAIVLDENVMNPAKSGRLSIGAQGIVPVGSKIFYLDRNDNILHTVYVSKDGFFEFKELQPSQDFILKAEVPGLEANALNIALSNDSTAEEIELVVYNDKFIEKPHAPVASPTVNSSSNTDKSPVFTFRYDYNATDLEIRSTDFETLIQAIKDNIAKNVTPLVISIEGSASKVPTQRYGTNEKLAEIRALTAREQIVSHLESTGLDTNRMLTITCKSGVNGPEFTPKTQNKKDLFADYQYVKVALN